MFLYFLIFILKAQSYLVCASLFDGVSFKDKYKSYSELILENKLGRDFQITTLNRNSSISILAPHGGTIEWGTSHVARLVAKKDLNLYLFEGLTKKGFELHITSTRFDEPSALNLVQQSQLAISIHSYPSSKECLCIGGGNKELVDSVSNSLSRLGIEVELPCKLFKGENPKNIVNLPHDKGVQIEISKPLMEKLLSDTNKMSQFVEAIRNEL